MTCTDFFFTNAKDIQYQYNDLYTLCCKYSYKIILFISLSLFEWYDDMKYEYHIFLLEQKTT